MQLFHWYGVVTSMENKVTTLKTREDGYLLYHANSVAMMKPEQSTILYKSHTILKYLVIWMSLTFWSSVTDTFFFECFPRLQRRKTSFWNEHRK